MTQPSDARDVESEARAILFESPNRPIFRSAEDADRAVRLVAAALKRRGEELARLQSALTQKNGEPKWSRGFRVIDGKTCEIIEGVIAKADYDALTAQHEATVRELGLVKQNERLAIQALTEAQREIERLRADQECNGCGKGPTVLCRFCVHKIRDEYEAQVRMLRETAHAVNCDCRVSKGSMDDFKTWDDPRCLARRKALATPPASQPSAPGEGTTKVVDYMPAWRECYAISKDGP